MIVLNSWIKYQFRDNPPIWVRDDLKYLVQNKEVYDDEVYRASIRATNCNTYVWTIQQAPSIKWVSFSYVKTGVCQTLERAKRNCDHYLKCTLKIKLLKEKYNVML